MVLKFYKLLSMGIFKNRNRVFSADVGLIVHLFLFASVVSDNENLLGVGQNISSNPILIVAYLRSEGK